MASNMLGTLYEAAMFLEEVEKLSSQSDLSSSPNTTTSSTASSPSISSPTNLHRLSSGTTRHSASWSVKMTGPPSPSVAIPVTEGANTTSHGLSPQHSTVVSRQRNSADGPQAVVSTNQVIYTTAKAVSLSVANLPQQTAAIPLIIGQPSIPSNGGGGVNISASKKYGYPHPQQQTTAALVNNITSAGVVGGVATGNGFQLGSVSNISGGITRIVDSSGHILHLPSGTAAAVNSNGGTTFSTLLRVNGNGRVENVKEEQFDNDSLPPSLVVISSGNFAGSSALGKAHHHGQPISIITGGGGPSQHSPLASSDMVSGPRDSLNSPSTTNTTATTGLDLSLVDFLHSSNSQTTPGNALSSNQKSTNTFTTTSTTSGRGNKVLVNQPSTQSVFTSESASAESIIKSTNIGNGKMQQQQQQQQQPPQFIANGLLAPVPINYQHTISTDKPEDLSSHLNFTTNGSLSAVGNDVVNILLPRTSTGGTTSTTPIVGAAQKSVLNLRDLSMDQLQSVQQQKSIYDLVYQKGAMGSAATVQASGRRRTISNNSTGGSQRSPSSMRSGTRESHNKLEKNRRAQMRNCFDQLKKELPKGQEEKKTSNLSILSSALNYISILKRTDKEWEHKLEQLAKDKIVLQNKLTNLKREMAPQLDKDPALAALVAGDIHRSSRTSESGVDEASSMDGYPSNGDETESFRGANTVKKNKITVLPSRNNSPLLASTAAGAKLQMLGDQVTVELKQRTISGSSEQLSTYSGTTILAMPNLLTTNAAPVQLPATAINLSSTANVHSNSGTPNSVIYSVASSTPPGTMTNPQQIFTSAATQFMSNNGHVLIKGGAGPTTSNSFNRGGNGLVIKEAGGFGTGDKIMKFGNSDSMDGPPAKMLKPGNGSTHDMGTNQQQQSLQHTQVLPIYSSTQNGGLRVIGHHTTTTSVANGSLPTSVVFSDSTAKYPQHLPNGMMISAPLVGQMPHTQYLTANTSAAQVHKVLLTGMGTNMSVPSGYSLPQLSQTPDLFARGTTSLPGGAQLNICRSPTSTPSPTLFSAANNGGARGNMSQKASRTGVPINGLSMSNSTIGISMSAIGAAKVAGKDSSVPNWTSASPNAFVPFQMINTPVIPPTIAAPIAVENGTKTPAGPKNKRASNGGSRGAKRKNNSGQVNVPTTVMITSQTSMEPVKNHPPLSGENNKPVPGMVSITSSKPPTTIK